MTPSEIVSRIHPNERTRLLIAFVAIEGEDQRMTLDARQLMQLARYTDLRDTILAQANGVIEQDQTAKLAAAPVRQVHRAVGSGGIYTLRGKNLQAVTERARSRFSSIDAMRSPSMGLPRTDAVTGDHIVEVRYYGV